MPAAREPASDDAPAAAARQTTDTHRKGSLMRRARGAAKRLRNRQGVTIVLVAILLVVMVGMVGVGVDFARMYAFKTQLKTVTDAAAMAGVIELAKGRRAATEPQDLALLQAPMNNVEGAGTAQVVGADVDGVQWDFATRTVVASFGDNYAAPAVNAVRVVGRYPATYTFGQVFGITTSVLVDTTVAALGGVGVQDCLKPWAVSYQTLIDVLYPPAGTKGVAYNLTPQDIADLTSDSTGNQVDLLQGVGDPVTPGNIAQVVTYTPEYGNGNAAYKDAIRGPGCTDMPIGPGTWLDTDPGGGAGQTENALKDFCTDNGGAVNRSQGFDCVGHPRVKLAMWDINNGASGNNLDYRVKYVGVFAVTGFTKATGQPGTNPDQVHGFFTAMSTEGGFTGATGATFKGAIVY